MAYKYTRQASINCIKGMLYFGALAPPIGSLVFSVPMGIVAMSKNPASDTLLVSLLGLVGFAFWSYLFGLIPAIVTGAIAGIVRQRLKSWPYFFVIGMIGLVAAWLSWYVLWQSEQRIPNPADLGFLSHLGFGAATYGPALVLLLLGLPGFMGGAITAWIFGKRSTSLPASVSLQETVYVEK